MADFPISRYEAVPIPVQQVVDRIVDAHCMSVINDRVHSKKGLLTFSWKYSDTTGAADSTLISDLMKGTFGFHSESLKIPSRNPLQAAQNAVRSFIATHDHQYSLLIFHYAGHGTVMRGKLHLLPFRHGSTSTIPFDELWATIRRCKADVLLLLDCCHAAAACRSAGERTIEILAACSEKETTDDGPTSFTTRFCSTIQSLSSQGIVSIERIARSMAKAFANYPNPCHSRLEGSGPISLEPSGRLNGQHPSMIDPIYVCFEVRVATADGIGIRRRLVDCMNDTMVNPGYKGEVLDVIASGNGQTAILQLPLQTAEWLRADPAFSFIRWDPVERAGHTMAPEDVEVLFNTASDRLEAQVVRLHQIAQSWYSSDRNTRIDALGAKIDLLISKYGSDSTYLMSSRRKLADEYEEGERYLEAAGEREMVLKIVEKNRSYQPNSRTIIDLYLAGRVYDKAREYKQEIRIYRKMAEAWRITPELKYLSFLTLETIEYSIRSLERKITKLEVG
jgi:hypothetical protein